MGHRADHTLCHHRQRPWNKEKVEAARQSPRCRRESVNGRQPGQCRLRKRWGQAEVLPHRLWDRWMGKLSQGEDALREVGWVPGKMNSDGTSGFSGRERGWVGCHWPLTARLWDKAGLASVWTESSGQGSQGGKVSQSMTH